MKKLVGILGAGFMVFTISCQKDQDIILQPETLNEKSAQIITSEISVDNAMADINFESDFFIGAEGMMIGMQSEMHGGMNGNMNGEMFGGSLHDWNQGEGFRYMAGQYPQYGMYGNSDQYPDSLVMDYGMGTQLSNGRMLSGEMIIHISGEPNGNVFMREITYNNFSVDSMMISGSTSMEIGGDSIGRMHNLTEDLQITMPDGTIVHRQSEITRQWLEGESTPLVQTDDMMQITGYVTNTVTENGTETVYKKEIVEPLIKTLSCRYFVSGIIELTTGGSLMATLDYGNGECDDVATLTKTGEDPVEIFLSENDHSGYGHMGMSGNTSQNGSSGMGMGSNSNGTGMGSNSQGGSGSNHG